jgi:hypothetical protein
VQEPVVLVVGRPLTACDLFLLKFTTLQSCNNHVGFYLPWQKLSYGSLPHMDRARSGGLSLQFA